MPLEKITYYRTAAFHKAANGDALHFWTIDPAYDKPGFFYVREHEAGKSHRYSARITVDMTEREALRKLAELEDNAAKIHRAVEETPENLRRMGENYTDALPWRQHPTHIAEARQNALSQQRKPKLKP